MSKASPVRDRIRELRRIPAKELKENPLNYRVHPKRQAKALSALLAEIGFADAVLVREQDGHYVIIDGHLRASLNPDELIPVLILDVTEAEAEKLLLTLDPLAGLALLDPVPLRELLSRVSSTDEAVRSLFASLEASAALVGGAGDPEAVPALPTEPVTKPGDLWVLGQHRLLCGDARSDRDLARLMAGERARMMYADPPYGVGVEGRTPARLRIKGDSAGELAELISSAFPAISGVLDEGAAIYISHPSRAQHLFEEAARSAGWIVRQQLVWIKDAFVLSHADFHWQHEPLIYANTPVDGRFGRGGVGFYGGNACSTVFEIPRPKASRLHPTCKPVELVRRLMKISSVTGDRVFDPFLGSGTSLIAAEELSRRGRFMELDPAYVDVAVRRWEAFTAKTAVREGDRDGH